MKEHKNKVKVFVVMFLVLGITATAQDTLLKKSIDITSTYKPIIREASKVLLQSMPLALDSIKRKLNYSIPVQPISLAYFPVEITPSALPSDSFSGWKFSNYFKLGFGNIYRPYLKAGLSFGNGTTSTANVFFQHNSAKGRLPFQQNYATQLGASGTYITKDHLEWSANLKVGNEIYYRFGYMPSTLVFDKKSLEQNFNTIEGSLQFRNTVPTELGLSFNPRIKVTVFGDGHDQSAKESNLNLDLPLEKSIGSLFGVKLTMDANLTNYEWQKIGNSINQKNQLFSVTPAFLIKTPNVYLNAGIKPSWDQSTFHVLPNVLLDITTKDQRFSIQAGWIGDFQTNTYKSLVRINPWLKQPDSLRNSLVKEYFAGVKGSVSSHLSYSAKLGFLEYDRLPLLANDNVDGKSFDLIYVTKLQALQVHSELGYTLGEDLSFNASFHYRKFTKVAKEASAWGLLPLELNAGFRWQVMKDLWIKSDLWAWDGAPYRSSTGSSVKGAGALDLNAGAEFKLLSHLNLWIQLNNIFNSKYQRWHQYQNYGFSIMGGIILNFDK